MSVSSLLLSGIAVASVLSFSAQANPSSYVLDIEYSGKTFFEGFSFWTGADPTHGFVEYVPA
jgi:hypothetical protein